MTVPRLFQTTTWTILLGGALVLAGACKDKNGAKQDANGASDGSPGDGNGTDAGTCVQPDPLPACATPVSGTAITFRSIGTVNGAALLATSPPHDPRLFVVERGGAIRIFVDEQLQPTPFIDLEDVLVAGGERGLLGLAFHPQYACNGQFFVYYTTNSANVVARCSVSAADPDVADPTCTPILSIPDFASNHNGGMIEFGSDGFLYIGTGDGGGRGDPNRNGQSLVDGDQLPNSVALLGKILRIDVDGTSPGKMYGIPAGNPYAAGGGAPEIFIRGLRNPWRWSFDRATGDLWIGDVGQGVSEELTVLRPAQQAGANLGWSIYEGDECCADQADDCRQEGDQYACDPTGLVFPQDTRSHTNNWISIIAGQTYRGTCFPDLVGWHLYTDYGARDLLRARLLANDTLEVVDLQQNGPSDTASIHADARGELYLTTEDGDVYRVEAGP